MKHHNPEKDYLQFIENFFLNGKGHTQSVST